MPKFFNNPKRTLIVICSFLVFGLISWKAVTFVFAEGGSGGIPNSGVTSRIATLYNNLKNTLGYGSDSNSPDWGTMWNRITTAATWAPSGSATATDVMNSKTFYAGSGINRTQLTGSFTFTGNAGTGDVLAGKTFYNSSSTPQTGTLVPAVALDFTKLQFSGKDDYAGNGSGGAEDYQGEEAVWTDATSGGQAVWKDTRTSTYWSADQGTHTNNFTMSSCPFFTTYNDVPNYKKLYNGLDTTNCGSATEAINYCATLNWGGRSDWYLPSQKEFMMAYIDGMYNQAGSTSGSGKLANAATFTTTNIYWTSSEVAANSAYAADAYLFSGSFSGGPKSTAGISVRCVARD